MDAGVPKEEPGTGPHSQGAAVTKAMAQASQVATRGDIGTAREALRKAREQTPPADRGRLDALDRSFRVDRAVLVLIGVTAAALVVIGLATLFH